MRPARLGIAAGGVDRMPAMATATQIRDVL